MDPRRVGVVLVLGALALLALLAAARSFPADLEQWACCGREGDHRMMARGPAVARYDPEADVTFAVFECSHGHCPFAVRLQGDAREEVALPQAMVVSDHVPPPKGTAPMDAPMRFPSWGREAVVENATTHVFRVFPTWPTLLLADAAVVAGATGVVLAWGVGARRAAWSATGAAAGVGVALALAAGPPTILPPLVLVAGLGGAGVAAVVGRRWAPAATAAAWLAAFTLAFAASLPLVEPFFVGDPTA